MNLDRLNPAVRSAFIYEKTGRSNEQVAADAKIIYVLSGDLSAVVDGEKFSHITSGSLLYVPTGKVYKISAQYLKAAVLTFELFDCKANCPASVCSENSSPDLLHGVGAPFDRPIYLKEFESVMDDVIAMCDIFTEDGYAAASRVSAHLKLLLIRIAEASDERALPIRMIDSLDSYIREHAREEITNTEIGAIFGYHPFYISSVIKESRGMTLRQYVIAYRIRLAKAMLRFTDKTIAEIAEETGFTDASYFTKSFRAAEGKTPKEWRAKFKEELI